MEGSTATAGTTLIVWQIHDVLFEHSKRFRCSPKFLNQKFHFPDEISKLIIENYAKVYFITINTNIT